MHVAPLSRECGYLFVRQWLACGWRVVGMWLACGWLVYAFGAADGGDGVGMCVGRGMHMVCFWLSRICLWNIVWFIYIFYVLLS